MASSHPIPTGVNGKFDIYESRKLVIDESLKHFSELTQALDEVCNQASLVGRSLHALEDLVIPEIIGKDQIKKVPSQKFKTSAHLMDTLDTFSKIMMSFSERIKKEAVSRFDNFIMQAVLPNDDQIIGIQEHNSQIVSEFRDSFFSVYNHFLVLAAELMEKFLICGYCSTPIGFPHQPHCLTKSFSKSNIWKKIYFDDKFVTYGMKVPFNELIFSNNHKGIRTKITECCMNQVRAQGQKHTLLPLVTNSWPDQWIRDKKDKNERKQVKAVCAEFEAYPNTTQSIGKPTIWTPTTSDELPGNSQITSFCFRPDESN